MADAEKVTDDDGQYAFTGLRAGTYSVEISGFDTNEVSFSSTSAAATVGVGETKVIPNFDGTYLRTAGILGQVSVDGEGLPGVTVTLVGEGEDRTETTDGSGQYAFSKLKSGTYQVAISGYDPEDYEFEVTSKSQTIATGQVANVPFEGTLLRTAGIAGRVSLDDGMGLDGVTVTLAGAAEATKETSNGGQYSFAGLAAGTYVLSITNPDEVAYNFTEDEMQKTVMLEDDQSAIVNFSGTHTRTASVSGMLFIDEVMQDKMYTDGEPSIVAALTPWLGSLADDDPAKLAVAGLLAKATVKLRGPDLNTEHDIPIMADGSFTTGEMLPAGSYQVELPVNDDDVAAGLAAAGVAFVGESMVVTVDAGGNATVNFPFRITMQTVATGARMGGGGHYGLPVEGVKLALYARADGTDMLDEATTDEMGRATFNFARADNTGPAGNDNIVFVRAMDTGHDALVVSGNEYVEIDYASTARLYAADHEKEVATMVNVAVAFDFWVKSNETARDGDEGLGGWSTAVVMVDSEDPTMTSDPLMKPDPDDDMEMVNATEPTDDGEDNMADKGKSTFSYTIDPTMLGETGITFAVAAVPVVVDEDGKRTSVQPDMGEKWEQSDALTHTHTGLELPPGEDDDMIDLGPIRITFTTQAVYVGTHRELDDRTGYTDYIGLGEGDARPTDKGTAIDEIEVTLMIPDTRGRLSALEYDHDFDDETEDIEATKTFGKTGMVSFAHIPADTEITIVAKTSNDMVILPDTRTAREIDAFGDQLDDYPDGLIVGAFGEGDSGARPDVWICPLARQESDDPNEICSTFAYKWATGTVKGAVRGLRKGDEDVVITLTPVNSNDDYADDLEDGLEVDYSASGTTYEFTGVADGRYTVTLEAMAGKWQEYTAKDPISVMHDETNTDDDYTGDTDDSNNLSATDLRGVIKGVIGNDANGTGSLTGAESRSGVMVNLHYAAKVGGSSATKNNYKDGGAVMDEDGDPRTAETDEDGVFSFSNLAVDTVYLLKPEGTDLYTVVRNGNPKIGSTAEETTDVVPHALVSPSISELDKITVGTPSWDAHTSTANGEGANDFVLLYKNGEVEGEVSDPSVRAAHQRSVVELHRCKVTDQVEADPDATPAVEFSAATKCTEYTEDDPVPADVDEDGEWLATDLMEGVYEVIVDLPAGYISVAMDGTQTSESTLNADDNTNTYFTKQIVELAGGRASDETDPFHIKDDNAGSGIVIRSVLIDGDACGTSGDATTPWTAPTERCIDNDHDDGTIVVKVTADRGATIRLSTAQDDEMPAAPGRSVAVTNGKNTNVSLPTAGETTFYLHVAAEDGYADNSAVTGDERDIEVRRDSDTRLNMLTIKWGGDRIDLNRRDLGLDPGNPDGETAPVTGTTTLSVQLVEGDNGADVPADEALNIEVVGKNTSFDLVQFSAALEDSPANSGEFDDCTTVDQETGALTVEANATGTETTGKGEAAICFRITDSNGETGDDEDSHTDNMNTYRLILTRK